MNYAGLVEIRRIKAVNTGAPVPETLRIGATASGTLDGVDSVQFAVGRIDELQVVGTVSGQQVILGRITVVGVFAECAALPARTQHNVSAACQVGEAVLDFVHFYWR